MERFNATYTDVSEWDVLIYQNTTGSRSKKIVKNPETFEEYFLKGSKELDTGEIRYTTEFWSEIVSSKIGQYLGFNVLDYNIGFNENSTQKIGCLSKSMVNISVNKLTEGKLFLTGYNSKYEPDIDKKEYTFQFIRLTLQFFNFESFIPKLLEVILFDAVIGNSDRHQENWGIITNFSQTMQTIERDLKDKENKFFKRIKLRWKRLITKIQQQKYASDSVESYDLFFESSRMHNEFSPIYDSGCCLGRELPDEKVLKMLKDEIMVNKYVNKGTSEIHWIDRKKKLNHFDLLDLLKDEYSKEIEKSIQRIKKKVNFDEIKNIIFNIDSSLPSELKEFKLSDSRKELMLSLIKLRLEKIFN